MIIPSLIKSGSQLARQFNLQNVQIIQPKKSDYQIEAGELPDPQLYLSTLGTSVLIDLTFHAGSYTDGLSTYSWSDFVLETILCSVNQTKNIVKTPIQGRNGTVKEYIGMGDYSVTINGIMCGSNGVYPKADVQALKVILTAPVPITVTSWFLQMFDINSLVFDSFDINQDEGGYSRQPFSIQASSDEEVDLRFG